MTAELFVGRQPELQRLREAFDGARAGRGGVGLISGAPGIGKTRLARELESYATEHACSGAAPTRRAVRQPTGRGC